jgi:hypothetical protein
VMFLNIYYISFLLIVGERRIHLFENHDEKS